MNLFSATVCVGTVCCMTLAQLPSNAAPKRVEPKALHLLTLKNGASPSLLAFSPDGKTLATAGENCPLQFWDAMTGQPKRGLDRSLDTLNEIHYSPNGRLFATATHHLIGVQLWDARTGRLVRTLKEPYPASKGKHVFDFDFMPDGRTLLANNSFGEIQQWEVASGKLLRKFESPTRQYGLTLSPNGKTLASVAFLNRGTAHDAARTVGYLWDVQSGKTTRTVSQMGGSIIFSPNGGRILTRLRGKNDNKLGSWSATSGRLLRYSDKPLTANGDANPVAFSPDGRLLVTGHGDKTIRVMDTQSGRLIQTMRAGDDMILSVAFSPSGSLLATGDWQGKVRLWRVRK